MEQFSGIDALETALADLGELLDRRGEPFTLFVIGGSAFLLLEPARAQVTETLDVAAQVAPDGSLSRPVPLPSALLEAACTVGRIHDLSPGWLNSAAAASFDDLVPDGALARASRRTWGALTLLVASRRDLIDLKFRAAHRRGARGERYRRDLALMRPSDAELEQAALQSRGDRTAEVLAQVRRWRDGS